MESALPAGRTGPAIAPALTHSAAVVGSWARRYVVVLVTLAVSYPLLLHDRTWIPGFVDESDNFLGGTLIAHGRVLYRDYFSHHMPLPYLLAALAARLGATSVAGYRVATSLLILSFWVALFCLLRHHVSRFTLALTVFTIALAHPIFWGHMLLGETVAAYALLLVVALVYTSCGRAFTAAEQCAVAILSTIGIASVAASSGPLAVTLAFYAWSSLKALRWNVRAWVGHHRPALVCLACICFGWLLILLWVGALPHFFDQVFVFNRQYYSRYVLGDTLWSALRSVGSGYYHFVLSILRPQQLLGGEVVLVIAVGAVALRLARQEGTVAGLSYGLVVALARSRGVAFHDQAYYVLTILSAATVASWSLGRLRELMLAARRCRLTGTQSLPVQRRWPRASEGAAVAYVLLLAAFLVNTARVYPWRYGEVYWFAYHDVVLAATQPEEPVYVGPIDPQAYLDVGRMPASRYAFYLPWMSDSAAITAQLIDDLEASQPPVVVFPMDIALLRKEGNVWQRYAVGNYASLVGAYLGEHYVSVDTSDLTWKRVLLRRGREDELRQRLTAAGLYRPAT